MKKILLTQGKIALVDDEDHAFLKQWKWNANKIRHNYYAVRIAGKNSIYMHRAILKAAAGVEIDHINGNGLDNRKKNLRKTTRKQNGRNLRPRTNGTSKFKGVCRDKSRRKWASHIKVNGKSVFLGRFMKEKDAALAYNAAALKNFGKYARINKGVK